MVSDSYGVLPSPQALVDKLGLIPLRYSLSGRNSAVECQLPKLDVTGSIPVARSKIPSQQLFKSFQAFNPFNPIPSLQTSTACSFLVVTHFDRSQPPQPNIAEGKILRFAHL
jgi:hypothetical protein